MSFSIILPSRNTDNLRQCIAAIRACGETARIIVVWDGERGPAPEVIADALLRDPMGEDLECMRGVHPFCFARNINIGIRAAGNDDVLLLNDDALLVTGHGFSKLAEAADNHQHVGVWSAAITAPNSLAVNPVHVHVPGLVRTDPWRTGPKMVPFVAVYIRRAVLDKVGLLDERFADVYGGEDDDYCYRVRQEGFKVAVHNGCVVEHGTLPSTFRPDGKGRSTEGARARFQQIHGFPMGSR